MTDSDLRVALEALLFASPEPLSRQDASRILEASEADIDTAAQALAEEYQNSEQRAFKLRQVAGGLQLCTKARFSLIVQEVGRPVRTASLSQAALETLAIIAYKQPITRNEIEAIRGVRVDSAMNTLVERELVAEVGRRDAPGRPILYGTTEAFLIHFGLNGVEDLPPFPTPQDG